MDKDETVETTRGTGHEAGSRGTSTGEGAKGVVVCAVEDSVWSLPDPEGRCSENTTSK